MVVVVSVAAAVVLRVRGAQNEDGYDQWVVSGYVAGIYSPDTKDAHNDAS